MKVAVIALRPGETFLKGIPDATALRKHRLWRGDRFHFSMLLHPMQVRL